MSYTIILILISIISLIFLYILNKRQEKSEILSFIATMLATLIGVLLAVSLSNKENTKKEKADTIKLLKSAQNIIDNSLSYTEGLENYINTQTKDTTLTKESLESLKINNPIPYPELLETIIASEVIAKNISSYAHTSFYSRLINLKKTASYGSIATYKRLLKELELLINIETRYLNNEIYEKNVESFFKIETKTLDKEYPYNDTTVID